MLEFTLAGIPAIFIIMSTIELSMGMWQYHTLAYALKEATRQVVVRGHGCTTGGNNCGMTVGSITKAISDAGIGISPSELNVTLTTASGQTQACSPLNSCFSSATAWPPSSNSDDKPGKTITISGQFAFHPAIAMLWPGAKSADFSTVTFSTSSAQVIQF
jgi:hypothetical protein